MPGFFWCAPECSIGAIDLLISTIACEGLVSPTALAAKTKRCFQNAVLERLA